MRKVELRMNEQEKYEVAKRAMTNDNILDNAKNVTEIRKLQNKLKEEKFQNQEAE